MSAPGTTPVVIGRYAIFDRIAAGGMAAVYLGRLVGQGGFVRTVAVKRLHPQFALDPEFVAMFLDEARLAARIRHPNVVATLDIVTADGELFLVMEYVDGESLSSLLRTSREKPARVPVEVAAGVMAQVLHGLHAAHEAKNDLGEPLHLVHRDVSPQNVLVGVDGVARVLDFGVAKALGKLHTTREGQLKGKLGYLSPEQVFGHPVTRRSDVFAAAVVLWEALAGARLFAAESEGNVLRRIMDGVIEPPSKVAPDVPAALDAIVMRGLSKEPADRFDTALAMAEAIEHATTVASPRVIAQWVRELARERLEERARLLADIESSSATPKNLQSRPPPAAAAAVAGAPTIPDIEAPVAAQEHGHTSISVASDRIAVPPPRRGPWARAALAGVVVGAAAASAFVVAHLARTPASTGAAAPSALAPGAPAVQGSANATSAAPPLASSSPALPPSSAAPLSSAPPSAPAASPARAPAARPPTRAPAAHARPSPAPSGSGLYTRE